MSVSDLQFSKARLLMVFTVAGMVTLFRLLHPWKAAVLMSVRVPCMVTVLRLVQLLKAIMPRLEMRLRVTRSRFLQSVKALAPILLTEAISMDFRFVQL